MDWITTLQPVIIAVVPLVVAAVKRRVPNSMTWIIPGVLAPSAALLANALSAYTTNVSVEPGTALMLGLAGVGLREVVDQLRKATAE